MRHYIPETTLTDYMYKKKEGGIGLTSIEDSVDASIQRLKDYIKNTKEN